LYFCIIPPVLQEGYYTKKFRLRKKSIEAAKKKLRAREARKRTPEEEQQDEERKALLKKAISILEREFKGSSVEVYLIGSILQPFYFTARSDIDVVLKNFNGDRFEFWARLEREIGRTVEIISFESCHFQEFVIRDGFKVVI
jgi:predicted nucleotidyltransferase